MYRISWWATKNWEHILTQSKPLPKTVCKTKRLVDNKKKMPEKKYQYDQVFVNDAKEDLKPKEGTVKVLQEYLQQSNEVMIKILEASVVKSMGDRFALLVSEFVNRPNNNLQQNYPVNAYPHYQKIIA